VKLKVVNIRGFIGALTLDIVCSCTLGQPVDNYDNPENKIAEATSRLFEATPFKKGFMLAFPWVSRMLGLSEFSGASADFLNSAGLELLKKRRNDPNRGKYNDFLDSLIASQSEANVKKYKLSDVEIASQISAFLLAGNDTTGSAVTYFLYNIGRNQKAQEKLYEEIMNTEVNSKGNIEYEPLFAMKYLDAAITESLRVFPADYVNLRVGSQDYVLGDTGITIPKGVTIWIPHYSIQHDPELHPEPEQFRPERFLPENKDNVHPYSFFAFGHGPRNCVGMRFAHLAMKLTIVNLVKRFKFHFVNEQKFVKDHFSLSPVDLVLKVEQR